MDHIVEEAVCRIQELEKQTPEGKHIVTGGYPQVICPVIQADTG